MTPLLGWLLWVPLGVPLFPFCSFVDTLGRQPRTGRPGHISPSSSSADADAHLIKSRPLSSPNRLILALQGKNAGGGKGKTGQAQEAPFRHLVMNFKLTSQNVCHVATS